MFGIAHPPASIKPFFRPLRKMFRAQQWAHFRPLVLAMAASVGAKNIAALSRLLLVQRWPQRLVDFVNLSPWRPDLVCRL